MCSHIPKIDQIFLFRQNLTKNDGTLWYKEDAAAKTVKQNVLIRAKRAKISYSSPLCEMGNQGTFGSLAIILHLYFLVVKVNIPGIMTHFLFHVVDRKKKSEACEYFFKMIRRQQRSRFRGGNNENR